VKDLAARLLQRAEWQEFAVCGETRLFDELPPRRRERFSTCVELAFRDRPRVVVLLRPKRPAGMDEEYFEHAVPAAIRQQAWTGLRHEPRSSG